MLLGDIDRGRGKEEGKQGKTRFSMEKT